MNNVIYTAISNDYDDLIEPAIITKDWQYICYTNNPNLTSKHWDIVYDPGLNSAKKAREKKITPDFKYDKSIWIDGRIEINTDLNVFVDHYCKKKFTLMKHPDRTSIEQEVEACIRLNKDNPEVINNQFNHYKYKGYPDNNGLVATGFIYREWDESIIEFCKLWNDEVQKFSVRDQLSFNFVSYYYNIDYLLIPFSVLYKEFLLKKHK